MEKQEMEVEWKLETENGNGNWKRKWKCTNRWRAVLRKVGIAQDTAYCVEMVLRATMEEGTESNPINLEDWRAVGLAEGCASNPIVLDDEDSFASSGSDFEWVTLIVMS